MEWETTTMGVPRLVKRGKLLQWVSGSWDGEGNYYNRGREAGMEREVLLLITNTVVDHIFLFV